MYASQWARWASWCQLNQVRPTRPTSVDLANYLASLSTVGRLSASSVRCHRAAICTTIRQAGGSDFAGDPLLRDVSRGVALAEARSPRRVPAWDLFLVLNALREDPFEPLSSNSFRWLTFKTLFLVTLASGRRASEVHGLSGLASDVALEPDGSMSLRFLPDFFG